MAETADFEPRQEEPLGYKANKTPERARALADIEVPYREQEAQYKAAGLTGLAEAVAALRHEAVDLEGGRQNMINTMREPLKDSLKKAATFAATAKPGEHTSLNPGVDILQKAGVAFNPSQQIVFGEALHEQLGAAKPDLMAGKRPPGDREIYDTAEAMFNRTLQETDSVELAAAAEALITESPTALPGLTLRTILDRTPGGPHTNFSLIKVEAPPMAPPAPAGPVGAP